MRTRLRLSRLVEELRRIAEGEGSAEARLERIIAVQLGQLEGRRDLAEVVTVNLRQSTKLLKQHALPLFNRYIEVMAGLVREGQGLGEFRTDVDPTLVGRAIWGSLDGILLPWAMSDGAAASLRKAAQDVSTIYLAGLRAQR